MVEIVEMNESTVKYIFLFLLGSSTLNFVIAVIARAKTKNKDFNILLYYWPTVIFTFIAAGMLRNSTTEIAFAYFLQIFSSNLYANIMISTLKLKVNWVFHISLQLLTMCLSTFLLTSTDAGFTNSLLPLCVVFSLPFYAPIKYALISKRKESSWVEKSIAVVYLTGIIHHFNMAFFRLDPNAESWGWAMTIAQYQCMSIFLPLMINDRREKIERKNLQQAIEKVSGNDFIETKIDDLYKQLDFQMSQKEVFYSELKTSNIHLKEEREINEILIRTISHDLANPLTVIKAYIEMLHSSVIPPKDSEKIWGRINFNINSAVDMMGRVRNAILTRTQASLISTQNISIAKCINLANEMFEHKLRKKNIKLICHTNLPTETLVQAEESALVQHVLANILSNAIKFSYQDSEIHINVTEANNMIQIDVKDFGVGIKPSRIDKPIFISTEGTNGEQGTGFGLMIMKYFLRHFGGTIKIDSKTEGPERGTTVSIMLQKAINVTAPIYSGNKTEAEIINS
jgi:signal transduction histidine kinase